ncbi:hypothetical protein [Streptomyces sp. NPDC003393]
MHDKPLSKIVDEFQRLRHDASKTPRDRSKPAGFDVDQKLVGGFVAGTLDPRGEADLAEQVAHLLPLHAFLPTPFTEELTRVIDHLGGQRGLMTWLDRHPGRPRLVARLYVLMRLLDQYSEESAVVTALRESRAETPYPAGLREYLVPDTGDETLADLSSKIEELLGDDLEDKAVELALATTAWVHDIAPRAERLDPKVGDLAELMEHTREDIRACTARTQ